MFNRPMRITIKAISTIIIAFMLYLPFGKAEPSQSYYAFDKKYKNYKFQGYIFRKANNQIVAEVLPSPKKYKVKINRLLLKSPSGEIYNSNEIENFLLRDVDQKRERYLFQSKRNDSDTLVVLKEWFVGTAHASWFGSAEERDDFEDTAGFAAFAVFMGVAAFQEDNWVSVGEFDEIEPEPGEWTLIIEIVDEKGKKHRVSIPFDPNQIALLQRSPEPAIPDQP